MKDNYKKCKECEYQKIIKASLEKEFKSKIATIILRTATIGSDNQHYFII